jgi:hypothetical protein
MARHKAERRAYHQARWVALKGALARLEAADASDAGASPSLDTSS